MNSMKTLTLENICPYLPYGLKFLHTETDNEGSYTHEAELETAGKECLTFKKSVYSPADYYFDNECCVVVKPILRPMNLTSPITVEGKDIIPIVELCKIASNVLEFNEDSVKYNEEQRQLEVTGKRGYKLIFAFDEKDSSFILMSNSKYVTVSNQLALFQWLAKHKFDYMNLIPEKLAIDVNTLDVNPYNT